MLPESVRVRAPSSIVFLCGGVIDARLDPPTALRDAFYRSIKTAPPAYTVVLAEDANPLTTDAGYGDLLSFESDIAQVVGLILLFAESAGSLAELGAFAASQPLHPRFSQCFLIFTTIKAHSSEMGPLSTWKKSTERSAFSFLIILISVLHQAD